MQYFQEEVIQKTLLSDIPAFINYLKTRISEIADGQSVWIKDKVIYDDPIHPDSGDIRSMTCFTDRAKIVKIISTNPIREKHYSVSVGAALLLDYEENFPVAVFDATMMSAVRTAAMAIISAEFANANFKDILIVGWGRVGKYIAKLLEGLGHSDFRVHDPYCTQESLPTHIQVQVEAQFNAEIVITATDSRKAFITPENCHASFIVSVGADTHFNFELSEELLRQRDNLYVDCMDAFQVGDLGRVQNLRQACGDIFGLYNDKYAQTFISVGSPLMDALTIEYLSKELM